ncbi:UNVERIFIED_CONTAM: hypothetical protein PYX00_011892 [Menopon gallinae]|uniref:Uncharacterized protein n=1 Tax=Menopon gallinae TaxID=328185 RepID=A0AAW2H8X7_9NEOP
MRQCGTAPCLIGAVLAHHPTHSEDRRTAAPEKLLRRIPFASKPRIEEMLANDDFSKYTQDDLDYFEEVLVQCSEDKCKDMIRRYFKVLSSLAGRSSGDGFFGRILGVFRRMLQNVPGDDKKHDGETGTSTKKRRRRSSTGTHKRVKRQEGLDGVMHPAGNGVICTGEGYAAAESADRGASVNATEHACMEHTQNKERLRRRMSYGYCPEDLVGKPISPDLFARALNPEYNFLPGLPKLVLGDIPTDEEEEYFRCREYLVGIDDDRGERCNFNDGRPYNCRKCTEKEYVEKIESIGLLRCDAGLLDVVGDRECANPGDDKREEAHSMQEKRRRIAGKYYVDWIVKPDAASAKHPPICESTLGVSVAHTDSKNAAFDTLEKTGTAETGSPALDNEAGKADGEDKNTVRNVAAQTEHAPFDGGEPREDEKARLPGPEGGAASRAAPVVPDSAGSDREHGASTPSAAEPTNAARAGATFFGSTSAGTVPESIPLHRQAEQAGQFSRTLSTEGSKLGVDVLHTLSTNQGPLSDLPNITLAAEGHAAPSYVSKAAETATDRGTGEQLEHAGASPVLQEAAAAQGAEGLPSISVSYSWSSAIAAHKKGAGNNSPAKKRGLQTMQSHSNAIGGPVFSLNMSSPGQTAPLHYTQGGAMERPSILNNNTGVLGGVLGAEGALDARTENTHGAGAPAMFHGSVDAGRQDAPSFANMFGAPDGQAFVPQGSLFGSPNDEAGRPNREGQDVASRFNRRKR